MVTAVKVLVKVIKLLVIFEKSTDGPLSQLIAYLEEKYGFFADE